MSKRLFSKSIYSDLDNADNLEEAIWYLDFAMKELEDFSETEETHKMISSIIDDINELKNEIDEQRMKQWDDEKRAENMEYMQSRGIKGLF